MSRILQVIGRIEKNSIRHKRAEHDRDHKPKMKKTHNVVRFTWYTVSRRKIVDDSYSTLVTVTFTWNSFWLTTSNGGEKISFGITLILISGY